MSYITIKRITSDKVILLPQQRVRCTISASTDIYKEQMLHLNGFPSK